MPRTPITDSIVRCRKCDTEKAATEFYPSRLRKGDRICRACSVAQTSSWSAANPGKMAGYQAVQRVRNPDALQAWRQANPDKYRMQRQRRRDRERGAAATLTPAEWAAVVHLFGGRCVACGRQDRDLARDHVVPLSIGAGLTLGNTQPLCGPCNSSKGAKTIDYRITAAFMLWAWTVHGVSPDMALANARAAA